VRDTELAGTSSYERDASGEQLKLMMTAVSVRACIMAHNNQHMTKHNSDTIGDGFMYRLTHIAISRSEYSK